jgi:hypothetical protein
LTFAFGSAEKHWLDRWSYLNRHREQSEAIQTWGLRWLRLDRFALLAMIVEGGASV